MPEPRSDGAADRPLRFAEREPETIRQTGAAALLSASAAAALGLLVFFAIVGVFGFTLAVGSTIATAVAGSFVWVRRGATDKASPSDRSRP